MSFILELLSKILLALITIYAIPATVKWIKSRKELKIEQLKNAETEEERRIAKCEIEMLDYADDIVETIEKQFEKQDLALKSIEPSLSLGSAKKTAVMSQLLYKAIKLKVDFDNDFWAEKVDRKVEFTRNVNQRSKDKDKQVKPV